MPGYKNHISFAVVFALILIVGSTTTAYANSMSLPLKLSTAIGVVWLAVLFSLFPDIDIKSKGQLLFYRLFFVLDLILIILEMNKEAALLGFLTLLPIVSRHRSWTHSVFAMILIPLPILLLPMYYAKNYHNLEGLPFYLGSVAGYFSHLVADGMIIKKSN
ncbi:MAG: metal-dependent hydrolase [Chlorobiota bacterium]|nr:metal-dependent hydrolase [Chlorobiota bacterium]QQS67251.1 MAG: metal-dependent hydrolase [Chlorobiota bacterium]